MLKRLSISIFILIIAASFCHAGSLPNMKEGKWEISMKMEMPGMPGGMPPFTNTQCLTKKDFVPQGSQQGQNQECKMISTKVSGDTVTWTVECINQGVKMKGSGKIIYKGTSFKGEMKTSMSNMEIITHMSGRHIGKCD